MYTIYIYIYMAVIIMEFGRRHLICKNIYPIYINICMGIYIDIYIYINYYIYICL